MKTITKLRMIGVLLMVLCVCGHSTVLANAGPPPARLWFAFTYTSPEPPTLEGIQLVICGAWMCKEPLHVQQYGICNTEGCMVSLPESSRPYTFDCGDNLCRVTTRGYYEYEFFKIVAQFSDRTRASPPLGGLPLSYINNVSSERAWSVVVQDTDLVVNTDLHFDPPAAQRLDPFALGLMLTWGVELPVAGIMLIFLRRDEQESLPGRLLMIALINLVSYPLVWLVFPAMRQFQLEGLSALSPCIGALVLAFAIALVWIYRADKTKRMLRIAITLLSLLMIGCGFAFLVGIFSYGAYPSVALSGLSYNLSVLYAEVSAAVLEWILLYVLNRKRLSLVLAGALSLVMNLASFLVGQMVF